MITKKSLCILIVILITILVIFLILLIIKNKNNKITGGEFEKFKNEYFNGIIFTLQHLIDINEIKDIKNMNKTKTGTIKFLKQKYLSDSYYLNKCIKENFDTQFIISKCEYKSKYFREFVQNMEIDSLLLGFINKNKDSNPSYLFIDDINLFHFKDKCYDSFDIKSNIFLQDIEITNSIEIIGKLYIREFIISVIKYVFICVKNIYSGIIKFCNISQENHNDLEYIIDLIKNLEYNKLLKIKEYILSLSILNQINFLNELNNKQILNTYMESLNIKDVIFAHVDIAYDNIYDFKNMFYNCYKDTIEYLKTCIPNNVNCKRFYYDENGNLKFENPKNYNKINIPNTKNSFDIDVFSIFVSNNNLYIVQLEHSENGKNHKSNMIEFIGLVSTYYKYSKEDTIKEINKNGYNLNIKTNITKSPIVLSNEHIYDLLI